MDKKRLLKLLENKKPRNIKISDKITKEKLIRSILEEVEDKWELPTVRELSAQLAKGKTPSLGTTIQQKAAAKRAGRMPSITIRPEVKKREKAEKHLKFATDLGFKAIVFNDAFIKMDENEKASISDVFSEDEINKILQTDISIWKKATRDPIYCLEKHIMTGESGNKIACFNSKLGDKPKIYNNLGKFVKALYMRQDDDKDYPPKMQEREFRGKNVTLKYIPMKPAFPHEQIAILPVSRKKYAVAIQLPHKDDPYLFKATPDTFNFFHTTQ